MSALPSTVEPPFTCADHALRWARRHSLDPVIQLPSTYSLVGVVGGSSKTGSKDGGGMDAFEKHGQAAALIAMVHETLHGPDLAYVAARYFSQVPDAMPHLVNYVIPGLGTGVFLTRFVQAMIANCFPPPLRIAARRDGKATPVSEINMRLSMRRLRELARRDMNDVTRLQRLTKDRLKVLHYVALDHLSKKLEAEELIPPI